MLYNTVTIGYCSTTSASKWEKVLNINKNTQIGSDYKISSVLFNGETFNVNGSTLASIGLYSENTIEFEDLTSANSVTFNLNNLGTDHYQIYARTVAYT